MPPSQWFKRSQEGLFGGKGRLTGHTISPSKRHVKRVWVPNVQRKSIWSDSLGKCLNLKVTTFALREMDRMGGLDNYVLGTSPSRLASEKGESLRKQILRQSDIGAKAGLLGGPELR